MASPTQLIQAVSSATGVPLATVVDIDRKLAIAGLRSKHGRGLNAARMTSLDAARLLVALVASSQANLSVEAVKRYADTEPDRTRSSDGLFAAANLDDLRSLTSRHSFVDGLAALIASATTGSLSTLILVSEKGWLPRIEVFAFTGATYGRIRIAGLPGGVSANVEYLPPRKTARATFATDRSSSGTDRFGDLEQSRRVTERTVLSIADLLAQETKNERTRA